MTCIWRPPLYGGHFCQVPRVAAIDRFDCIYIYIYIYIYICIYIYIYIYFLKIQNVKLNIDKQMIENIIRIKHSHLKSVAF